MSRQNDVIARSNMSPHRLLPPVHHKVINFVAGCLEGCGTTYSQMKCIERETKMQPPRTNIARSIFLPFNKEYVMEPHHDILVIYMPFSNYDIKRILMDNGSDVNIS